MTISLLKKIGSPEFLSQIFRSSPRSVAGVDVGLYSAKVVELEYRGEKALLKTYGEILSQQYLKGGEGGTGFLRYLDSEVAALVRSLFKEANVSTHEALFAVPASSSFVTTISLPHGLSRGEIIQAIPYEARKYVPVPLSEVVLDWDVYTPKGEDAEIEVLIAAVPREILEKFKRISELAGIKFRALEIETFSLARALAGNSTLPTAILNMGHQETTLTVIDEGRIRLSNDFAHGSLELTRAIERGLEIARARAEAVKKEVGLSEKVEERETTSLMTPILGMMLDEVEKTISHYNRRAQRKIQKVILAGGGSNLKGIVDQISIKLGVEVTKGNPFSKIVAPAFLQPVLREIGPSFSTAVGLALREAT